ncbi:MAG: hypothetical protein AUH05_18835 [Ktedonobacter sp. 13_2_20CM_53_11]|nr:MAG: hypothetical protein AUH05_18835 [Ktedonobacter sp. 13_2_20CM_53_11]
MKTTPDFSQATDFIWRTARLLDRHRFAFLFLDGPRDAVLAALRPYQNADGGFGHALEPDLRGPVSQPLPVWSALRVLDEINAFDDPMVKHACDYLMTITTSEGGVPFALPSIRSYPRVPWLQPDDQPLASINPTAGIAGLLHKHRVDHPWLERATTYCWHYIESGERWVSERDLSDFERASEGYDVRAVLPFLDFVPDRNRAEKALERIRQYLFEQKIVALDPAASGDVHTPLDFAPRPTSIARQLFSDETIDTYLEALVAAQQEDGGWPIGWPIWTPVTGLEWRGWATIDALTTLRAYGRLS